MRARTSIAALGTAAVLGLTGAIAVPALARAKPAAHTLKFTSIEQAGVSYGATAGGENDKDVSKAGKVIGFNTYGYVTSPRTGTATGWVTVNLRGGFLYGVFRPGSSAPAPGTVTGGTGVFAGAKGTIVAKPLNALGSRTAYTVTYHF